MRADSCSGPTTDSICGHGLGRMGHSSNFARWPHLGPIPPMDGGGHLVPLSYVYGYRGGVGRRGVAQDTIEDNGLEIKEEKNQNRKKEHRPRTRTKKTEHGGPCFACGAVRSGRRQTGDGRRTVGKHQRPTRRQLGRWATGHILQGVLSPVIHHINNRRGQRSGHTLRFLHSVPHRRR